MRTLRTARRFAVPRWMIERATRCRLAGDWRGACDAAGVDAGLDLARIGRDHGAAVAAAVEDDLLHLAPDLLRWHLFQAPAPGMGASPVTLAVHGRHALRVRWRHPGTPSQRLELEFAGLDGDQRFAFDGARERWDSRRTGELLDRCGGYDGHLPFLTASGDRLPEAAWGGPERIIALQDAGDWAAAWTLAGFDVGPLLATTGKGYWVGRALRDRRHDLTGLRTAVAAVFAGGRPRAGVPLGLSPDTSLTVDADLRVWYGTSSPLPPMVPVVRAERAVDFDLVRHGILPLEHLHPLVGDALFPGLAGLFDGPPETVPDMAPVRVRCQGEWHILGGHEHTPEETRRELALRALGGAPLRGCFAARAGWRDPDAWTPKALRLRRRDIVLHAVNGDGPAIAAWLDAGLDPHLRDHHGRTLLHLLAWLPDPAPVVARLRHAGLDPHARDKTGLTPLRHALDLGGTPAAIRALEELGCT
ncbi:hypothetical protein [Dactylosporangium sp. NPDC006015]|uniref:hypothetical protein n=1 Tax=Dactylosporangium sp. NPDC006015 TaxID=3154576 RepID=UPI0033B2A4DC